MAVSPTKSQPRGRAQSPGPTSVSTQGAGLSLAEQSAAQLVAETAERRAQTSGGLRNCAKILGVLGFLVFTGVEWAAHCQRRSIQSFLDATATPTASPPSGDKICRWNAELDELDCEPQALNASTWAAEPSALCPGTRFNRLVATDQNPSILVGATDGKIHVLELLDEKLGRPSHYFEAAGLLVTMLCMTMVLPGGSGLPRTFGRICLAILLPILAACGVAVALRACDGDDAKVKRVLMGCFASTLVLASLASVCSRMTSRSGATTKKQI